MSPPRDEPSKADAAIHSLLMRARMGDAQALGELLEQFRPRLNKLASQLLSAELAQKVGASDLVQETCLDAMRDFRAARVDHVAVLEAWLVTMLANNVEDWRRRFEKSRKRELRRERSLDDVDSRRGILHATLASHESSPGSRAMKKESADLMQQALARLSRGYRQIIVWRTHERQSWQEIARRLDRSEDAVRMLWKRAVARLKQEFLGAA